MNSTNEEQLRTVSTFAKASERQANRLAEVVKHLREQGLPTATTEVQMNRFIEMTKAYRERRAQLEAQIKARR